MHRLSSLAHLVRLRGRLRPFRLLALLSFAFLPFVCTQVFAARSATAARSSAATSPSTATSSTHSDLWKKVDEAINAGLPKTALEHVDAILAATRDSPAGASEYTRALLWRIALVASIEGNHVVARIRLLQAELAKAPASTKPLLEAVLAHWYLDYFRENRWKIMRRSRLDQPASSSSSSSAATTSTSAAPASPNFESWDVASLLAEIDRHLSAALSDTASLKAVPIAAFADLLAQGKVPDTYRPTLYDFLAHKALDFYRSRDLTLASSEDSFEIDASSPISDDVSAFLAWLPQPTAAFASASNQAAAANFSDPKYKAIRLLQDILRFHQRDADRSAFLDADLARLAFAKDHAVGEAVRDRYKAALRRFADANAAHETAADALALLASELRRDGDLLRAHTLAGDGVKRFPKSRGANRCRNLIQTIEARETHLQTESVWNSLWPSIDVTYRNVDRLHFRAIAADFTQYISSNRWEPYNLAGENRRKLLDTQPTIEWSHALPPTSDFQQRTEKVPVPPSLKPGFYFILASHAGDFDDGDNLLGACPVWVGDLVLVSRIQTSERGAVGFVLRAGTGDPVSGARVTVWKQRLNENFTPLPPVVSDADGRFTFDHRDANVLLVAEHEGQITGSETSSRAYIPRPAGREEETAFFTDRALYRPGQSIHYKGIVLFHDPSADRQTVLSDVERTVVLEDPNGREAARAVHRTNDFGSFSGVFTAPKVTLTGHYTLRILSGRGVASVIIEEYKRPKFQVEIDAPLEAAALGAPVAVVGRATAYTGAPIDGAKVSWRVERSARLPSWCWWLPMDSAKPIAHGNALTGPDGSFQIRFTADPDRSLSPKNEPVFSYVVHADVTDTSGETRSSDRTLLAGYTALQASLSADDWQTAAQPVLIAITSESIDGTGQPASGTLTLHALRQPQKVARPDLQSYHPWIRDAAHGASSGASSVSRTEPAYDPSNPDTWPTAAAVFETAFSTDATGAARVAVPLPSGIYRASLATKDRFGKPVTARRTVFVLDPSSPRFGVRLSSKFFAKQSSVEPGDTYTALWGTGYDYGRAYVEVECDGRPLKSYWTAPARTQEHLTLPVDASMRGGFTLRITHVRENRASFVERVVDVPWTDKRLSVRWEHFRSKLTPGQKETWTAVLTGPDDKPVAAEMAAALYDASLDQFHLHRWPKSIGHFRTEQRLHNASFHGNPHAFRILSRWQPPQRLQENWSYRSFPYIVSSDIKDRYVTLSPFAVAAEAEPVSFGALAMPRKESRSTEDVRRIARSGGSALSQRGVVAMAQVEDDTDILSSREFSLRDPNLRSPQPPPPALDAVVARRALDETAFFLPHLISGDDGSVRMEFTAPEALTEWRFLGFAHDAGLRSGFLTDKAVTSKDLMVQPNAPRFLREGDVVDFTVKVTNRSDRAQSGTVRLTFANADSLQSADAALGNRAADQAFEVPARQSRSFSWRIAVPDGQGFLAYKAVAATRQFSDGEEGFLPILSRRTLVTESLPLSIRGKGSARFSFDKLLASGASDSLRHQSLTVQMVSNPAWYAVMALPYLMEFPHECSEQLFNRLYANALARHIAAADPKIRRVFDQWRDTPALDSPLEKNQDLKSVMIEETPWLRQARAESQARRDVGVLFDAARLDAEAARAARSLADRQLPNGLWSWFPGGAASEYISLYIVAGYGRLRQLGVQADAEPAVRALLSLDAWIAEAHRKRIQNSYTKDHVPSCLEALYLYARSFFLEDRQISSEHREAVDFLLERARASWVRVDGRQSQAHLALALRRFGDAATPDAIVRSLRERSIVDAELGMHWRDLDEGWWWHRAPIETQALMIEVFSEIASDARAVEDCKVWLLKQKQTQAWSSTKSTADAVYALLLRGEALLANDALTEVSLAGQTIRPERVEAGTGFYEKRFAGNAIQPEQGRIVVNRPGSAEGVSWGAVHWQYLEDTAKITPHQGTPLRLKKTLYVAENTPKGRVLRPVSGPLSVGDELVVRLELSTDRDLEFVHLKDQRGSGTEPVSVLSGYRYLGGFSAYESTRDTASHFFIDWLSKGVHVLEYATRVQLRGRYQTGIAELQCMYAPEFNSHSESFVLEVR